MPRPLVTAALLAAGTLGATAPGTPLVGRAAAQAPTTAPPAATAPAPAPAGRASAFPSR